MALFFFSTSTSHVRSNDQINCSPATFTHALICFPEFCPQVLPDNKRTNSVFCIWPRCRLWSPQTCLEMCKVYTKSHLLSVMLVSFVPHSPRATSPPTSPISLSWINVWLRFIGYITEMKSTLEFLIFNKWFRKHSLEEGAAFELDHLYLLCFPVLLF